VGDSGVAAQLAASQEGLSYMKLVFELYRLNFLIYVHMLHKSDYSKADIFRCTFYKKLADEYTRYNVASVLNLVSPDMIYFCIAE
jgi:hypothetical protein